ncbi:MAG: class I SAM-dependent methyltransferase [Candidatus Micrarchaeota archaeon]
MQFSQYNAIARMEAKNWWYAGRRDLLELLLVQHKKFECALDVGCGTGSNLEVISRHSKKSHGIDYSPKAIQYCRKKGFRNLHQMDAQHLGFNAGMFDLVVCTDVLEHLDDKRAISEFSRVMRKGGLLILAVPAHKYLWNDNDDISSHKRRYEKERILELLAPHFKISKLSYWNFLSYFPALLIYNLKRLFGSQSGKSTGRKQNNLSLAPSILSPFLLSMLKLENRLFNTIPMPQGVSIIAVATKK